MEIEIENIVKKISQHPQNANIQRVVEFFGFENYHKLKTVTLILDVFHFIGNDIQTENNINLTDLDQITNEKPIDKLDKRVRLVADMSSKVYIDNGELITDLENIDPNRPTIEEYAYYWLGFKNSQVNPSFIIKAIESADQRKRFDKPAGSDGVVLL